MPIIKSAKKRVKVTKKKTAKNRKWKEELKDAIKSFEVLIEEDKAEEAKAQLKEATKIIDKCASKNLIHKNNAARKKSRLAKMLNDIT